MYLNRTRVNHSLMDRIGSDRDGRVKKKGLGRRAGVGRRGLGLSGGLKVEGTIISYDAVR